MRALRLIVLTLLLGLHGGAVAGQVVLAVAANCTAPMRELAAQFEQSSGHKAVISFGSTGKLYAQILHGAPYQVFLAADTQRPQLLHAAGRALAPRTYAIGTLALWSPQAAQVSGSESLKDPSLKHLAIANPKTAPYGVAAQQVIAALGLSETLQARLVRGENIAQTYQFVATGNAQLGFVALSQLGAANSGSYWLPPRSLYTPLRQDAVLLNKGMNEPGAQDFFAFLFSPEAKRIMQAYGYTFEPVAAE